MLVQTSEPTDFDLVFEGINFVTALLAFTSIKSGCNVAFKNVDIISSQFHPEISNFYPQTLVEVPTSIRNYSFFENCASLFPYYLIPQRLLFLTTKDKLNTKFHLQADFLLNLDREFASLPVTLAKYPAFESLIPLCSNGLLHYELRFDRQRAIMDLLKKCKAAGAVFLGNEGPVKAKYTLKSSSKIEGIHSCLIPDYKLISGNNVRIDADTFSLDIQSVLTNSSLILHFHQHSSSFELMKNEFEMIINGLDLPKTQNLIHWFQNVYNDFNQANSEEIVSDQGLDSLRERYFELEKRIEKKIGKKLSLPSVVKLLPKRKMSFLNFQQIQRECDEKFDEAKQTGVSYALFTQLFYRYSASIDQMIELAYEKTGSQLSPETVWKMAEQQLVEEERKLLFE